MCKHVGSQVSLWVSFMGALQRPCMGHPQLLQTGCFGCDGWTDSSALVHIAHAASAGLCQESGEVLQGHKWLGACQKQSQGVIQNGSEPFVGCRAEQVVGTFWRWVAQPLLFGLIGTGVNFHTIKASTLPKSLIVVLAGAFTAHPSKLACSGDCSCQSACSAL